MYDKNFEIAMKYVFGSEGGFNDDPDDLGGRTNYGVTQSTYNGWRKQKGLPEKDVKNISKNEAKQLYYDEFWKPSGASKLEDPREAYLLFDMAVNSGSYEAKRLFKESDGNIYKFIKNRNEFYKNLVERRPTQKKYAEGWQNRLKDVERNVNSMVNEGEYIPPYADDITPFDNKYKGELKKVDNLTPKEKQDKKNKYQYLLNKKETATGGAAPVKTEVTKTSSGGNKTDEDGHWITTPQGNHVFIEDSYSYNTGVPAGYYGWSEVYFSNHSPEYWEVQNDPEIIAYKSRNKGNNVNK